MKITTRNLAWICVVLLVLYPLLATLIVGYLAPGDDGILAAPLWSQRRNGIVCLARL